MLGVGRRRFIRLGGRSKCLTGVCFGGADLSGVFFKKRI